MTVGLLMIIAALFLTSYNLWDERRANDSAAGVLEQITLPSLDEEATPDYLLNPSMEMPTKTATPDYLLNPSMEMPTKTIDGFSYIGVLDIPALDISLPIMADWSYPKLKIAPNRYLGSVYTDDMIIAGHNYRNHFGSLKVLSYGDKISFTDMDGNIFDYKVVDVQELKATDVQLMEDGDWDLTLFTCTLGGERRTTIRTMRTISYD